MLSMIERIKQPLWTTVYEPMGAYIVCLEILIYWSQIQVNSITSEISRESLLEHLVTSWATV